MGVQILQALAILANRQLGTKPRGTAKGTIMLLLVLPLHQSLYN
jgi:hypothetical protein